MSGAEFIAIPGFQIRSMLGAGTAGTVYLAVQESLSREVALKVLTGLDGSGSSRRRFRREAQSLAKLENPHLVQIYEYRDDPELPWIALEYLPGGTLRDRIRAGLLPLDQVERLARDLFAALEALHGAQLVHRDVKPANVLYRSAGDAVLGDLGLVKEHSPDATRLTKDGDLLGTLAYLAPEVLTGANLSADTDRYAAGVTLYEALTGRHPCDYRPIAPGFQVRHPAQLRPEAPQALTGLIADLLHPEVGERPRSATDVLARLRGDRPARPRTTGTTPARPATAPPARRLHRGVALALGCLLAVALTGLLAQRGWFRGAPGASAPALTVRPTPTSAIVRAPPGAAALLLCVFDAAGQVHQCYEGAPGDTGTTYAVDRLRPGTRYRAQLLSRSAGARSSAGEIEFRTPLHLKLHGLDALSPPGLWLSTMPPAHARWAGTPAGAGVDATPRRVPLPADRGPRANDVLELALENGEVARLDVGFPPSPARPGMLPLGLVVPSLSGAVTVDGVKKPLVEFLCASRPTWVAVSPRPDGGPNLAPEEARALWYRAGIATMYLIHPTAPPAKCAWAADVAALDGEPAGQYAIGIEHDWIGPVWQLSDRGGALANMQAWREWLQHRAPPRELAVPPALDVLMRLVNEREVAGWARALGPLTAIEVLAGGYADFWAQTYDGLEPRLTAAGLRPAVRWAFIPAAPRNLGFEIPMERAALAGCFLHARARFPGVIVFANLHDLTRGQERTIQPQWLELVEVARRVANLTFQRALGAEGAAPRLRTATGLAGLAFAGEGRKVQLLFSTSPGTARFTPARPGTLTARDKREARSTARAVLTTTPFDVPLPDSVAVFEELTPVTAHSLDGPPVAVDPP